MGSSEANFAQRIVVIVSLIACAALGIPGIVLTVLGFNVASGCPVVKYYVSGLVLLGVLVLVIGGMVGTVVMRSIAK